MRGMMRTWLWFEMPVRLTYTPTCAFSADTG